MTAAQKSDSIDEPFVKFEVKGLKKDNYFAIAMGDGMVNVDMVQF